MKNADLYVFGLEIHMGEWLENYDITYVQFDIKLSWSAKLILTLPSITYHPPAVYKNPNWWLYYLNWNKKCLRAQQEGNAFVYEQKVESKH